MWFFEIFMKGKRWWKSYLEEESGSVLRRPGRRGKRRRRCWACSVVTFTFSATLGFDDDFCTENLISLMFTSFFFSSLVVCLLPLMLLWLSSSLPWLYACCFFFCPMMDFLRAFVAFVACVGCLCCCLRFSLFFWLVALSLPLLYAGCLFTSSLPYDEPRVLRACGFDFECFWCCFWTICLWNVYRFWKVGCWPNDGILRALVFDYRQDRFLDGLGPLQIHA